MKITILTFYDFLALRLWLLNRAGLLNSTLLLTGTNSLFQKTVEQINNLAAENNSMSYTLVSTNEEHHYLFFDKPREMKCPV